MPTDKIKVFKGWDSIGNEPDTPKTNSFILENNNDSALYTPSLDSHAAQEAQASGYFYSQNVNMPFISNSSTSSFAAGANYNDQPVYARRNMYSNESVETNPIPYSSLPVSHPTPSQLGNPYLQTTANFARIPDLNSLLPPIPQNTHIYMSQIKDQQRQRLELYLQNQAAYGASPQAYNHGVLSAPVNQVAMLPDDNTQPELNYQYNHINMQSQPNNNYSSNIQQQFEHEYVQQQPTYQESFSQHIDEQSIREQQISAHKKNGKKSWEPVINLSQLSLNTINSPHPPSAEKSQRSVTSRVNARRIRPPVPMTQMSSLGPDLDTEAYQVKAMKMERLKAYSLKIRSIHKEQLVKPKERSVENIQEYSETFASRESLGLKKSLSSTWNCSLNKGLAKLATTEFSSVNLAAAHPKKIKLASAPPVLLKKGSEELKSRMGLSAVNLMIHDRKIQEQLNKVEERLRAERRKSYYKQLKATQQHNVQKTLSETRSSAFSTPQPIIDDNQTVKSYTSSKLPPLSKVSSATYPRPTVVKTTADESRRQELQKLWALHQQEQQAVQNIIFSNR